MQPAKVFAARSFRTPVLSSAAIVAIVGAFGVFGAQHTASRAQLMLALAIPALLSAAVLFFASIGPHDEVHGYRF
jgi:hypothetical protein